MSHSQKKKKNFYKHDLILSVITEVSNVCLCSDSACLDSKYFRRCCFWKLRRGSGDGLTTVIQPLQLFKYLAD